MKISINISCQLNVKFPNINIFSIGSVRTRFEFLAQQIDGLRPKKPKTMNL